MCLAMFKPFDGGMYDELGEEYSRAECKAEGRVDLKLETVRNVRVAWECR